MAFQCQAALTVAQKERHIVEASHVNCQIQITIPVKVTSREQLWQREGTGSVVAKHRSEDSHRNYEAS